MTLSVASSPVAADHISAILSGSLACIVMAKILLTRVLVAWYCQSSPAHSQLSFGSASSKERIAPPTSFGWRCMPRMEVSFCSTFPSWTIRRPAPSRRVLCSSKLAVWSSTMYPPSPPRRSINRPAVVPSRLGATTSSI